jgi:ATP-dependent RNA helicase DDX10/DBP4
MTLFFSFPLQNPEYVAVHEMAQHSTPQSLVQNYIVCNLQDKLDLLFSFIRTHLKTKILVFLSSCKEVRYVYETFKKMRPGVPLMELHGKQKQQKRLGIFYDYCKKQSACLFATDIGLHFPFSALLPSFFSFLFFFFFFFFFFFSFLTSHVSSRKRS